MKGKSVIAVKSPVKPDLVFSLLFSKTLKQVHKAILGKKTKLDDDIAQAIVDKKIWVDSDIDKREIIFHMEGSEEEIEKWQKMKFRDKIAAKGIKQFIEIRTERDEEVKG